MAQPGVLTLLQCSSDTVLQVFVMAEEKDLTPGSATIVALKGAHAEVGHPELGTSCAPLHSQESMDSFICMPC